MRLSDQQLRFFHHFGYLVIRQLFDQGEVASMTEGFERTLSMCGIDHGHMEGARRSFILGAIDHLPRMNALLDHPGILGLAGGILGDDFNYASGDGRFYSGDTSWHADGGWGQLFACKILFYLDPLTRDTGALRVIPGSHDPRHPLRQIGKHPRHDMRGIEQQCGIRPSDFPGAEAIETVPGDVIIFNHDLFHAAFGGGGRRRMFTMNLTRHAHDVAELTRLRQYLGTHSPGGYKMDIGGMYFRPMFDGASPERMRHLEQCASIHDELFPALVRTQTHREQIENMLRVVAPEAVATAGAAGLRMG